MKNHFTTVMLLIFIVFCSCHTTKIDANQNRNPSKETDAIVFLVFKITKGTNGLKNKITFIEQTKSVGKMKPEVENTPNTPNYLTVICYDNTNVYKTLKLPHPLYKQVEYLNDSNQYVSKDIEIDEDTFFIRLPFDPKIKKISIFEKLRDTPKEELFTLNL